MKTKKLWSIILSLAMVLSLLPQITVNADVDLRNAIHSVDYRYYSEEDGTYLKTHRPSLTLYNDCYEWNLTGIGADCYFVKGNISISKPITVKGDRKLILTDGCKLTVDGGINVPPGSTLTIYDQSEAGSGTLIVYPGDNTVGIGGGGNVIIHGGNITATGDVACAGIGGDNINSLTSSNVTIYGGNITATGGAYAAGIGGCIGSQHDFSITICGGNITATGGALSGGTLMYAAGIGGGNGNYNFNVTINGGNITATGGADAAGIGGGKENTGVKVNINGGTVNATGGDAAIGSDDATALSEIDINVNEHTVLVNTSDGGLYTEGEYGGWVETFSEHAVSFYTVDLNSLPYTEFDVNDKKSVKSVLDEPPKDVKAYHNLSDGWYVSFGKSVLSYELEVSGDVKLILIDYSDITVRGGIKLMEGSSLTIYGQLNDKTAGSLKVAGNGIHGENGTESGALTIHGGNITTTGDSGFAGICCEDLTICGGNVTANGGENAAGIGGGNGQDGGNVTIYRGFINATGKNADAIGCGSGGVNRGNVSVDDNCKIMNNTTSEYLVKNEGEEWIDLLTGTTLSLNALQTSDKVSYCEWENGGYATKECIYYSYIKPDTETLTSGWYTVSEQNTLIDHDVNVQGNVNIILKDKTKLEIKGALKVTSGNSLTIYAQQGSSGYLYVYSEIVLPRVTVSFIGDPYNYGDIIIHGGKIDAMGRGYAGIEGNTTVYGGNITSQAAMSISAIHGTLTMFGGSVVAKKDPNSPVAGPSMDGIVADRLDIYGGRLEASGERAISENCVITTAADFDKSKILCDFSGNRIPKKSEQTWNDVLNGGKVQVSFEDKKPASYRLYNEEKGVFEDKSCETYTFAEESSTWTNGWYVCDGNITTEAPITVSGDVNLIIEDGKTFTADAGIRVPEGSNLMIYGQSAGTGKLVAKGTENCAGIGGGNGENGGNIILYSGSVTATAGENAPHGIGAGTGGNNNGSIDIPYVPEFYKLVNAEQTEYIKEENEEWIDVLSGGSVTFTVAPYEIVEYLAYDTDEGKLVTQYCRENIEKFNILKDTDTEWKTGWYVFDGEDVKLDGVTVKGDVKLILKDGSKLTVSEGIGVDKGNSLTIYAQSEGENTGKLITTGAGGSAGIGGDGKVIIHGGKIKATGGDLNEHEGGAGIGGNAYSTDGGDVTIYGGTIEAIGADGGAGIGSGYFELEYDYNGFGDCVPTCNGTAGNIKIYGGNITADGGYSSAGIGGGYGCDTGNIDIHGGTVNATGGGNSGMGAYDQADGIGCGWFDLLDDDEYTILQSYPVEGGTVTIDGNATAFSNGKVIYCIHSFEEAYSDDGNGKHSRKCTKCGTGIETAEHDFIYVDNEDGTHSQKCKHCGAYGNTAEHNIVDGECTLCAFPYKTIKLSNGTEITYEYLKFVIDNNGVLTQYKGSDEVVDIPEGVKQIEHSVFRENKTIKEVNIPASVELIGDAVFYMSSLTTVKFEKGSHLTEIRLNAFNQTKLTSFTVPASVKTIGDASIGGISTMTELIFEEGSQLETIGNWAFSTDKLTTVNIPKTVKSIGVDAFGNMNFTSVYVNWKEASKIISPTSDFSGTTYSSGTLYVPYGTKDLYSNHETWGKFQNIVEMEAGTDSLSMDVLGNEFFVTPSGDDVGTVIVALYDSEDMNRLLDVKVFELEKGQKPEGTFTQAGYVKAYWWSDFEKMIPLCKPADGIIKNN